MIFLLNASKVGPSWASVHDLAHEQLLLLATCRVLRLCFCLIPAKLFLGRRVLAPGTARYGHDDVTASNFQDRLRDLDDLYRPSFSGHGCCIWWRHVWMSPPLRKIFRRKLLSCIFTILNFQVMRERQSQVWYIKFIGRTHDPCESVTATSYKEVETGDIQVSLYCDGRRWARALLSHGEGRPSWPFLHLPPTREPLTQSPVSSRTSPRWLSRSQQEFLRNIKGVLVWAWVHSTLKPTLSGMLSRANLLPEKLIVWDTRGSRRSECFTDQYYLIIGHVF